MNKGAIIAAVAALVILGAVLVSAYTSPGKQTSQASDAQASGVQKSCGCGACNGNCAGNCGAEGCSCGSAGTGKACGCGACNGNCAGNCGVQGCGCAN